MARGYTGYSGVAHTGERYALWDPGGPELGAWLSVGAANGAVPLGEGTSTI